MRVFGEGVVFWGFISRATPKNDFIQRGPKELHSVNVGPHTGFKALLGCVVTLRVIRGFPIQERRHDPTLEQVLTRLYKIERALTTPPKEYLTTEEAATFIGMSKAQLENWRTHANGGPAYHKVGRAVRYSVADLRAFVNATRTEALQ